MKWASLPKITASLHPLGQGVLSGVGVGLGALCSCLERTPKTRQPQQVSNMQNYGDILHPFRRGKFSNSSVCFALIACCNLDATFSSEVLRVHLEFVKCKAENTDTRA